jgi:hypothetical protein
MYSNLGKEVCHTFWFESGFISRCPQDQQPNSNSESGPLIATLKGKTQKEMDISKKLALT